MYNLQEYRERILYLASEAATLLAEKSRLEKEACEKYFPYRPGQYIRYKYLGKIRTGRIMFASLSNHNPFKLKINVKPVNSDLSESKRVVLHSVNIAGEDVAEIIKQKGRI